MAGSKGSKYYDIFLKYKIFLSRNNKEIIDESVFMLLLAIKNEMSLSSAAEKLNISYRKAWGDIKKAEQILGFSFVERKRGGIKGGESWLTNEGDNMVNSYLKLTKQFDKAVSEITKDFFNSINN